MQHTAVWGGCYLWRILKRQLMKCVAPISNVNVWAEGDVTVWTDTAGLISVTEHNSWLTSGQSPRRRFSTERLWGFSLSWDYGDGWRFLFLCRALHFRITLRVLWDIWTQTFVSCCRVGQRSCGKVAKPGSKNIWYVPSVKKEAFLAW